MPFSRRQFLQLSALAVASPLFNATPTPPDVNLIVPDFVAPLLTERDRAYLITTLQTLHTVYRDLFPYLPEIPAFVVLNTLPDVLLENQNVLIAPELLGREARTLADVQSLLVQTRFGSVATPHRGTDLDGFGQLIYLKQHPDYGYRPPDYLLLEELLHAQQDVTLMRHIITQDELDPTSCLHSQLKGISELGAHIIVDALRGEPDYVFLLDDGQPYETTEAAVDVLTRRFDVDVPTFTGALLYDVDTYIQLNAAAVQGYGKRLWEMVTTWRYSRDADGEATGIAPAFIPYPTTPP
jgi:hypothetical protein